MKQIRTSKHASAAFELIPGLVNLRLLTNFRGPSATRHNLGKASVVPQKWVNEGAGQGRKGMPLKRDIREGVADRLSLCRVFPRPTLVTHFLRLPVQITLALWTFSLMESGANE